MKKNFELKTRDFFNDLVNNIGDHYEKKEASAIVFHLLNERLKLDKSKILSNSSIVLDQNQYGQLTQDLERLKLYEPLQYIIGYTDFFNLKLKVDPSVLIPRPETEELVELIVNENHQKPIKILDIGTGSGCIALALKSVIPNSTVVGVDVSSDALTVAKENAELNNLQIDFFQVDILKDELTDNDYDLIVSNPPYVRECEKKLMLANVLNHEPPLALFVPDQDPLLFYRTILEKGKKLLKTGGKVYFEINEALGEEILELMADQGFIKSRIVKDLSGKDRIAITIR